VPAPTRTQLVKALTDAFILNDPLQLLRHGAPLDEFEAEIGVLADIWLSSDSLTATDIERTLNQAVAPLVVEREICLRLLATAATLLERP
jgi:hypothetical protein